MTDGKKPTLLPAPFRARLGSEPARDDTVRLGRLSAYRYADLRVEGLARPVSLYVVPTTDGVATVACVHGSPAAASHRTCGEAAASLRLVRSSPISLGPDRGYARAVSTTVRALNAQRGAGRSALSRADTRREIAAAAAALADAYERAARRSRAIKPPPEAREANAAIATAFAAAGVAHDRMAAAARGGQRRRYSAATNSARRSEQAARRALAALAPPGYR